MFEFLKKPSMMSEAVRRLGVMGATTHGIRHVSAAAGITVLGPFQLRLNPTDVICNHTCPMCLLQHIEPMTLRDEKKRERRNWLECPEYAALLDAMPAGLTEVNVSGGGEPLAHPGTLDIMRDIRRRGLRGFLWTNGTLLKPDVAAAMVEMTWNRTRFSVHAGDRETYRTIQGVDKFETLRENMLALDRLRKEASVQDRMYLNIVNVLQRANLHAIEPMFDLAEEAGADYVEFELIVPLSSDELLSIDELEHIEKVIAPRVERYSFSTNIERFLGKIAKEKTKGRDTGPYRPANRCSVGYDSAFIKANGDVMPCCFSDEVMGNLRDERFAQIWKGDKYREFRARLMRGEFADYCSSNRCKYETFLHD